MKSILLSIRPKWVAKILNGEKTIEIRKKFPKDYIGWVYLYCAQGGKYLLVDNRDWTKTFELCKCIYKSDFGQLKQHSVNGKVVARFWCDKVKYLVEDKFHEYYTEELEENEILKKSCLTYSQLFNYLKGKVGYAIHISKLEVFEKPRELREFYKPLARETCMCGCEKNCKICECRLTKAPQNYCYIESEE